jgi:DUF4097 and DUF4098 domain-containing protein YvlB
MRLKLTIPAVAAGLLCLTACDVQDWGDLSTGRFTSDFHYSYPLRAGGTLTLETFNGSVEISPWEQNTIDISGTKYGPTQNAADSVKIDIDHTADSVSIRVPRPYDRRNREGAKFVVKVPHGVVLDRITSSNGGIRATAGAGPSRFKTSNGSIHVEGLDGNLDAQTSNGPIEVRDVKGDVVAHTSNGHIRADGVDGTVDASTSNSSVRAEIGRPDRNVRIETSNGPVELWLPNGLSREVRVNTNNSGITLHLPPGLNARVLARTSNSSITTDFDVSLRGQIDKNHMDATIGSGGPLIDLSTSNGSIRLLKGRSGV